MTGKKDILENVIEEYRPDLDEEYRAMLLNRLTSIEFSGREVYELLSHMGSENKRIFYLGLITEVGPIKQHLSFLASYPKSVSAVHEVRSTRA